MKFEARNSKSEEQIQKAQMELRDRGARVYDLEPRTLQFARDVRSFIKALPRGLANDQDVKQLVRSSGSIGANDLEANDAVSRKDFILARKEAKEAAYWLQLVEIGTEHDLERTRSSLIQEATELMRIFGAIVRRSE